jgi:6-phosphogluconolactonase
MRTRFFVTAVLLALGCVWTPAIGAAGPTGFVYALVDGSVANNNQIYAYVSDGAGGLAPIAGFPLSTGSLGAAIGENSQAERLVYDRVQNRLYALNPTPATVSAYSVDAGTGALTELPFSPISLTTPLDRYTCIAVSPDGTILVAGEIGVGLNGRVDSYKIGASAAARAAGSPFSNGANAVSFSMAFSRDGAFFYVGGPDIAELSVNATTGVLTPFGVAPVGGSFTLGYQTDSSGRLFAGNNSTLMGNATTASIFGFTSAGGALTQVTASPVLTLQEEIQSGLLHPSGFYLTTAQTSNDVMVFQIGGSGAGTTMTPVGVPVATLGSSANVSILEPSGTLVFTANRTSRNLTTFQFDPATGVLTRLAVQAVNTFGAVANSSVVGLSFVPYVAPPTPPSPSPSPAPTPSPITAFPPSISEIADQTVPQNLSASVPFSITGAILTSALRTSVVSSNRILLPVSSSTLSTSCSSSGACTLYIAPSDGRAGSAMVTVTVTDGYYSTSRSLNVIVPGVRPSTPAVVLANVVGTAVVLTWTATDTGPPTAYAIGWGTTPAASNLPTQLVAGDTTRFEFSALPSGTYYFRVYGVGTGDLGIGSSPSTIAIDATTATVPGPPLAPMVQATGGGFNAGWTPPLIGSTPALYEVQVGTTFGAGDVGSATTETPSYSTSLGAGSYWVRARAASGGSTGAWSSSVQIPVNPSSCATAPTAPILLPVTTTSGYVTFTWMPTGFSPAAAYEVQIAPGAGLASVASLTTGSGTSLVWAQTSGSFAARVVASNGCGASVRSNEVAFTIQP